MLYSAAHQIGDNWLWPNCRWFDINIAPICEPCLPPILHKVAIKKHRFPKWWTDQWENTKKSANLGHLDTIFWHILTPLGAVGLPTCENRGRPRLYSSESALLGLPPPGLKPLHPAVRIQGWNKAALVNPMVYPTHFSQITYLNCQRLGYQTSFQN